MSWLGAFDIFAAGEKLLPPIIHRAAHQLSVEVERGRTFDGL